MSNSDADGQKPAKPEHRRATARRGASPTGPSRHTSRCAGPNAARLGQRGAERRLLLWRGIAALLALGLGADFMFHRSSVSPSGQQWVETKSAPPVQAALTKGKNRLQRIRGLPIWPCGITCFVDGVDAIPSHFLCLGINLSQITTPGAWDADQSR